MREDKNRHILDFLFRPCSVAVIGASNRPLTIGNRIVRNLQNMQFAGPIYPVHPKDSEIEGLAAYPSISHVLGDVDLAHIIVKNVQVPRVLADCAHKGVKVVIINTAGFKEVGPEGGRLEEELVQIARDTGIRIFGPNCQGIINTDPEVNAYCNFTFTKPQPGYISIFSQSGGVGEVINNRLCELGEGMRMYASTGNACDINCPEVLEYWGNDPQTRVIICHLENIEDPEKFIKVAREVSQKKPILVMLTGRTSIGAQAVAFHCGGTIAGRVGDESLAAESGVLAFRSLEEICQAARAFVHVKIPRGRRVGIITNTGGPGIIAADELSEAGCELPEPDEATKKILRNALHPEAIVSNPVDVLATAGPEHFRAALEAILGDSNLDSLLFCFVTPFFVDCEAVARKVVKVITRTHKPIVCVVMTEKTLWSSTLEIFRHAGIPTYSQPEIGARVLAAMTKYGLIAY